MPRGLTTSHVVRAVDWIEERTAELVDLYYEQANIFSAIVGIHGVLALSSFSRYRKHKHPDVAQQRFPDLSLDGRSGPSPEESLESKASIRPWAVQSHYDHPGWYIVWRYAVDPTRTLKPGREVAIWRVDLAFLHRSDWKYESSRAGEGGGGRTHTFGLRHPSAKLRGAAVYRAPGVVLQGGRPVLASDPD
jgi:hypothetical protein